MSVIEETVTEITELSTNRRERDPFILTPDLPMTEFIEDDDPLLDIYSREIIDRWNDLVRQNIESGGEIERRKRAAIEAVRANTPPPFFMPDDYIAELPPPDVLARWACEANSAGMRESYREEFLKVREELAKKRFRENP